MAQRNRAADRNSATEPKFYLPAGTTSSSEPGRIGSIWAALFDHGVEPPK